MTGRKETYMNYRIFVKKKENYQVEAVSLFHELQTNLNIQGLQRAILYNVYDIFNGDENDLALLKAKVLSETVTDEIFDEVDVEGNNYIAYEYLPGQYDQRADSAQQCLMLLNNKQDVVIRSGKLLLLEGELSEEDMEAMKHYLINPVEMREKDLHILCLEEDTDIEPVPVLEGFRSSKDPRRTGIGDDAGRSCTYTEIF